jgi:hypothetical protein
LLQHSPRRSSQQVIEAATNAYSTGSNVAVADVEFNNASAISQGDTARLIVFASDMVQPTGVSLPSLSTQYRSHRVNAKKGRMREANPL